MIDGENRIEISLMQQCYHTVHACMLAARTDIDRVFGQAMPISTPSLLPRTFSPP
jgi:hypothetical protein